MTVPNANIEYVISMCVLIHHLNHDYPYIEGNVKYSDLTSYYNGQILLNRVKAVKRA